MRNATTVLTLVALVVLAAVGLGQFAEKVAPPPPPFEFSAPVYRPYRERVCAGEAVVWDAALTVHRAPTATDLVVTLFREVPPGTVVSQPAGDAGVVIYLPEDIGKRVVKRGLRFPVPIGTAPGRYQVRLGLKDPVSASNAYKVPFEVVKEGC